MNDLRSKTTDRLCIALSSVQIGKSIMKSGNVTALPSVYRDHPTNTTRTIIATPHADLWY